MFETGSVTPNDDNTKDKKDDNQKTPQIQSQLAQMKRDHLSTVTLIYVLTAPNASCNSLQLPVSV